MTATDKILLKKAIELRAWADGARQKAEEIISLISVEKKVQVKNTQALAKRKSFLLNKKTGSTNYR